MNSDRLNIVSQQLNEIANHSWYKKYWTKLKTDDREMIREFALSNLDETKPSFEMKLNRLFLDNPNKPKNWTIISDILSIFNTRR